MNQSYDIVIIGGGTAGSVAARYLASRKWTTLLVDKDIEQGFLGGRSKIHFFPGFPKGTNGSEIIRMMRKDAQEAGAFVKTLEVTNVDLSNKPRKVTGGDQTFEARAIIIATGASARTGYSEGEKKLIGCGVSHDPVADAIFAKNEEIAIVGRNKAAAESAEKLSKYTKKIHFVIPSNKLDIDNRFLAMLQKTSNIDLLYSASLKSINGEEWVSSITVFTGGQEKNIPVKYVFDLTHDYKIINNFLYESLNSDPKKGIPVNEDFQTSLEGIFACGDVLCSKPQVPSVTVAQGVLAAMSADRYLSK